MGVVTSQFVRSPLASLLLPISASCAIIQPADVAQPSAQLVPGGCSAPAPRGYSADGCFLIAEQKLGALPRSVYWHLYTYDTRAEADRAARRGGLVAGSFGRIWLYYIGPRDWRPAGGQRVAVVGPLTTRNDVHYLARYMEAQFSPGMKTGVHTHSGPEAWYVLTGAQCLETPDQVIVARRGEGAVVPQGPPMVLSSIGSEVRQSVLLVLHPTSEPWTMAGSDWKPEGKCPAE